MNERNHLLWCVLVKFNKNYDSRKYYYYKQMDNVILEHNMNIGCNLWEHIVDYFYSRLHTFYPIPVL